MLRTLSTLALITLVFAACSRPPSDTSSAGADAGNDKAASVAEPLPEPDPKLLDPYAATEQAPDTYKVKFETTKGPFVVEVQRAWAPLGADRFFNLVKLGYYDGVSFFRVIDRFMVQFGLHGHPKVYAAWKPAMIKDEPAVQKNKRGTITFANSGKNTRNAQVFINFSDNPPLDSMGFSPFGRVVEGMDVVEKLYGGYGEGAPKGSGPDQRVLEREGNPYLKQRFPKLDYVERATLVGG